MPLPTGHIWRRHPGPSSRNHPQDSPVEQIYFVDAHHIRHWAHGGETNLENLVLLCRFHHSQLHEVGYTIAGAGKSARFMDPEGVEIPRLMTISPVAASRF